MTDAQREALIWLRERGGDASIQAGGAVLARGEVSPQAWRTWRSLIANGQIEEYREGKMRRLRITSARSQR